MFRSLALFVLLSPNGSAFAEETAIDEGAVRQSVERGLALVTAAARRYPEHRKCFSCHHQTLPLFAARTARDAGFEVPVDFDQEVLGFTARFFDGKRERLAEGQPIGGRDATVAYGLWAYETVGAEPNETTAALVESLLRSQREDGSWHPPSKQRPPLAESPVTLSTLAALGFEKYATEEQTDCVAKANERIRKLLATFEPKTHEDFVFRLWGRWLLDEDESGIENARRTLLARQRADGGFAQSGELESDAYATGQALYVLLDTGTTTDDEAVRRSVAFLLKSQLEDGSWHVKSRAKPVQVYFDNGDPHGRDQFISTPATAWAVAGLAKSLTPPATESGDASE